MSSSQRSFSLQLISWDDPRPNAYHQKNAYHTAIQVTPEPYSDRRWSTLALDPILAETGFALLDPHTRQILTKGTIPTKHTADQDRLIVIATHITMLLEQYRPAEIAIERLFVGLNRSTALTLGAVRNLLL